MRQTMSPDEESVEASYEEGALVVYKRTVQLVSERGGRATHGPVFGPVIHWNEVVNGKHIIKVAE